MIRIKIVAMSSWWFVFALYSAICFAESSYKLETVVVSAKLVEEDLFDSPYRVPESSRAATWQMDREEIDALHPDTLYDILASAPGVNISFQGRKSINAAEARGGGRYAIILNGNYVPWTHSGRVLANFPTKAIASVRVVRDSTVLTLGPIIEPGSQDSVAQGYIIITTRKPETSETRLSAEYGSNNMYKGYASHGDNSGVWYYDLACGKNHDDGEKGLNNALDSTTLFFNGGFDNRGFRLDLTAYNDWASREIQRATDITDSKRHDAKWEYDPLNTLMLSARLSKEWTPRQTTALGIYSGKVTTDLHTGSYSKPQEKIYDQEDRLIQADLRHTLKTDNHLLTFGSQTIFWETPTGQFYYEDMPRKEELYSLYTHDDWMINDRISVDSGFRADRKHITKGVERYAPIQATTNLIENKWTTPTLCLATGTRYKFNNIYSLSARYSFSRNETDSFLTTQENASLDSEQRHKYESSMLAEWSPALKGAVTLFLYDLRNTKISVGSTTIGDDTINIYGTFDVVQKGFEIIFNGALPMAELSYDLNYSWQTADDHTKARQLPENIASLRLNYNPGVYMIQLTANYVDTYESNSFSKDGDWHEIGGYTKINANIGRDFHCKACDFRASVFGRNLTDTQYQTRLGWDHLGRTYGISLDFVI